MVWGLLLETPAIDAASIIEGIASKSRFFFQCYTHKSLILINLIITTGGMTIECFAVVVISAPIPPPRLSSKSITLFFVFSQPSLAVLPSHRLVKKRSRAWILIVFYL